MTTTTTNTPYSWLKHLPQAVFQNDQVPLLGNSPPFPLDALSAKLQTIFDRKDLTIEPAKSTEWRSPDDLLKGFGNEVYTLYITLAPALPPLIWAMTSQDIQYLMSILLTNKNQLLSGLEPAFQMEFYQFIVTEVLSVIPQLEFDHTLSPHMLEIGKLPQETALTLDVGILLNAQKLTGRLIFSNEFRHAWKEKYTPRTMDIPREFLNQVEVTLHIEAGRTEFKQSEWAAVNLGDFIFLDQCSLKQDGEGRVMLTVYGHPIFRGKIKDGDIKILENPLYQEGGISMVDKPEDSDDLPTEDEEGLFDENGDEEEDDSWLSDEALGLDDLDEEESAEEVEDESSIIESETEAAHDERSEIKAPEASEKAKLATPAQPKTPGALGSKKPFTPEDIPLSITIEVGRVQMTLQKLMELQPGNMLELNVRPENGVDLVVNGKRIAKGELILVGEALGVRILDIG